MTQSIGAAVALLILAAGTAQASCLPPEAGMPMTSTGPGQFLSAVRLVPAGIKVGAPFAVDVRVCSPDNARIERLVIDAHMPAHRHGMNYRPEVTAKGEGVYEARGFLFHMPGKWEIMLSVTDAATTRPQHFTLALEVR